MEHQNSRVNIVLTELHTLCTEKSYSDHFSHSPNINAYMDINYKVIWHSDTSDTNLFSSLFARLAGLSTASWWYCCCSCQSQSPHNAQFGMSTSRLEATSLRAQCLLIRPRNYQWALCCWQDPACSADYHVKCQWEPAGSMAVALFKKDYWREWNDTTTWYRSVQHPYYQ